MATAIGSFLDQPIACTRDELIARFGRSALDFAISTGVAVRVLPAVYAGAAHARSFTVRAHAALLWAGPEAAISGASALFAWELIDSTPSRIEVWIPHSKRLKPPPWLSIRRGTEPIVATERGRLRIASPAFAILHGYGALPVDRRADVVYRAVRRHLVSVQQLRVALVAAPRVKARRDLERRIDAAAEGAESYLEEHSLWRVFNTRHFERLIRQHEVVHEGELFRLDIYDPVTKTAVECDGERYHGGTDQRLKDIRRDAVLATRGLLTLRYSFKTLVQAPEWCRQNLLAVMRAREVHPDA